jgi:SAM-dependent methyltransferase
MDLPSSIPSDSFDIAHLHQVNVHLPDPVKALRSIRRVIKPGGLVSTRDMLRKLFTPTTAAIEENWVRIAAREDCSVPFTGEANHVWMHDAGFPWDHITTGAAGWEEFGENKHGVVRSLMHASRRKVPVTAEDVEWAAAVERDLVAWGENPASRLLGWDSWVVATK